MNVDEARGTLVAYLARYRRMTFAQLSGLVGEIDTGELPSASGTMYQFEVSFYWDDPEKPNDVLRVFGSIDDGGVRAYNPLCECFLMAPNGAFIDE